MIKWIKSILKREAKQIRFITNMSYTQVEIEANKMMLNGWKPLGGIGYMAVKTGGNKYDHEQYNYYFITLISA